MKKNVIFIHGAGGYEEDAKLVASLKKELGEDYELRYRQMPEDETASPFGSAWPGEIANDIAAVKGEVMLVGHSLGASMLLKHLSESGISKPVAGVFLLTPPFWSGEEDWVQPLKLRHDFSDKLPKDVPFFFYRCKDDEEVPAEHFNIYKKNVPWAVFRELESGGHQFGNDLAIVAGDIQLLRPWRK